VVQSEFFAVGWGEIGRLLFLVVAAAFLADTWLVTADAVARIHADIVQTLFPASRRYSQRRWYYLFIVVLTAVTCLTMLAQQPGQLILLSAVIGFAGTVLFPIALYLLNYRLLPRHLPTWAQPRPIKGLLLGVSFVAYATLAVLYVRALLSA